MLGLFVSATFDIALDDGDLGIKTIINALQRICNCYTRLMFGLPKKAQMYQNMNTNDLLTL